RRATRSSTARSSAPCPNGSSTPNPSASSASTRSSSTSRTDRPRAPAHPEGEFEMKPFNRLPALAAAIVVACVAGAALAFAPAVLAQGNAQPAATAPAATPPAADASAPAPDAAKAAAATPQPPPPVADKEVVENPYGLEALWKGGDFVSRGTLIILILMSMGSWYIMFVKVYEQSKVFRQARRVQATFFQAGSVSD